MKRLNARGVGLVLSMIVVAVFAIMTATAIVMLQTLETQALYQPGSNQAQAIAEAGMQDALMNISSNTSPTSPTSGAGYAGWTTGFNKQSFAGGYFTVTVSTQARPWVTSTGYAPVVGHYGRPSRQLRSRVYVWPLVQMPYGIWAYGQLTMNSGSWVDSFNSQVSTAPTSFGTAGSVYLNDSTVTCGGSSTVEGTIYYPSTEPPASCAITRTATSGTLTQPWLAPGTFQYDNDDLTGISPASAYSAANGNFTLAAGATATLTSGAYFFNTLTNLGTITLNISSGPVVMFVGSGDQGTATQGTIASFGTITNPTGIPSNFMFYTRSNDTFTVTGVFCGMLSAENSGTVAGTGSTNTGVTFAATAYGSVTANDVTLIAPFHYDISLSSPAINMVVAFPGNSPYPIAGWSQ